MVPYYFPDVNETTAQPHLKYATGQAQVASGYYNPISVRGYMSPTNNTFLSLTGSINGFISATVYDPLNNDIYMTDNSTGIFHLDGFSDTSLTSDTTVSGAVFSDLEIYQVNGVRKLFCAYDKSGGGNLLMYDLPASSASTTWLSGTASGGSTLVEGYRNIMCVADNGFMYVGNGNVVHKIDGTTGGGSNGTAEMNILVFPKDFVVVDMLDYRGNLAIALQTRTAQFASADAYNERVTGVYFWDRISTQVRMRDFIPVQNVREIRKIYVSPEGELRLICIGGNRLTQIRRYNGNTFQVMEELGVSAYPNVRDSVISAGNLIMWLGVDGIVYGHGKIDARSPEAVFQLGSIADNVSQPLSATGALFYGHNNALTTKGTEAIYLSFVDNGGNKVRKWFFNGTGTIDGNAQSANAVPIIYPVQFLPKLSTVRKVILYFAPGSNTGGSTVASVDISFNQSSGSSFKTQTITQTINSRGYIDIPLNKPYVNSIQIKVTPSTNLDADTFHPLYAFVDYDATPTNK